MSDKINLANFGVVPDKNKSNNNIYISGALMASLFKHFHIYGNNTVSKGIIIIIIIS